MFAFLAQIKAEACQFQEQASSQIKSLHEMLKPLGNRPHDFDWTKWTSSLFTFRSIVFLHAVGSARKRNLINQQQRLIVNLERDFVQVEWRKKNRNKFKASGQWDSWNKFRSLNFIPLEWRRLYNHFMFFLFCLILQFSTWRLEKLQCRSLQTVLVFHRKPSTVQPHHSSQPTHVRWQNLSVFPGGMWTFSSPTWCSWFVWISENLAVVSEIERAFIACLFTLWDRPVYKFKFIFFGQ